MKMSAKQGFVLPIVLLVSIAMIAIGLSLVQSTSSMRSSLSSLYTSQIASEAAQSGIVYANYCYVKDGGQGWSKTAGRALTPETDCLGQPQAGVFPKYLVNYHQYQSSFSVGDIESPASATQVIDSTGLLTTLGLGGGAPSVLSSVKYDQKQVLRGQVLKASQSASGQHKTCAIVSDKLYCWGQNHTDAGGDYDGNLGDGTTTDHSTPVAVDAGPGSPLRNQVPIKITSARFHSCVLTSSGEVLCWGDDTFGQLGNGGVNKTELSPVKVVGQAGQSATDIATTADLSCSIAGGKIYCWGANVKGSVGDNKTSGTKMVYSVPTAVATQSDTGSPASLPDNYTATQLATGGTLSNTMCALADGVPYCWGGNEDGQLGNGTIGPNALAPTRVDTTGVLSGLTILDITQGGAGYGDGGGYTHVCVLASSATSTGSVYCWGSNKSGQLGNASNTRSAVPVAVSPSADGIFTNTNVSGIYAGIHHVCANYSNWVYCWGENSDGQLGTGNNNDSNVPVAIAPGGGLTLGSAVTQVSGGGNRGCAIANYINYCWGLNGNYQLGDGTNVSSNLPVRSKFLDPNNNAFLF